MCEEIEIKLLREILESLKKLNDKICQIQSSGGAGGVGGLGLTHYVPSCNNSGSGAGGNCLTFDKDIDGYKIDNLFRPNGGGGSK